MLERSSQAPLDAQLVERAWNALALPTRVEHVDEISAEVSTNRVYRVALDDGHEVVAKTSSYGSFVHFRQDHDLIEQWRRLLGGTRFARFLAGIVESKPGSVFTYREQRRWVVFYHKAPFYDFLPRVLSQRQIESLAQEMAEFHRASEDVAARMNPSWKTLGADVASLYDALGNDAWREERGFAPELEDVLRTQCDLFLTNSTQLGYHSFKKLPVLVDWNIGNFSVGFDGEGFKFYSRWDYDWFRIEPRMLDFYFCARVVRSEGDKTLFSYSAAPLFEPRFLHFLRHYHAINPLSDEEVLFLKEAFRFFLLNYVVRAGEHFFRPSYCARLQKETVTRYLPDLDALDFSALLPALR